MIVVVLADVWVEEVVKEFVEVSAINVRTGAVIDALSAVYVGATIDVVSDIGVEVLADANANILVATMADL